MASYGVITGIYGDGVTLRIEGESKPTSKHYKVNSAIVFSEGDRVHIAEDGDTYVVEYPIGNPLIQATGISSVSTSATLAQLITEWNQLIAAIDSRGYKWIS